MALAVIRSLGSAPSLRSADELGDLEQELVDQYALALAGSGIKDPHVGAERRVLFEFVRFLGRPIWTAGPEDADRFLTGLRRAGQKLTVGDDRTGWSMKLFRDLAGYYLNVGASQAIVEGKIKMLDFARIDRFVEDGVLLDDATSMPFDAVVMATGYNDVSDALGELLGGEVARKIGRCVGIGEDGEYPTMSRPTAQPHLWLIGGAIVDARKSSDILALQVIAQMEGLVPSMVRVADGSARPLDLTPGLVSMVADAPADAPRGAVRRRR